MASTWIRSGMSSGVTLAAKLRPNWLRWRVAAKSPPQT